MSLLDRLAALVPFRQPVSLHDPRRAPFDPPTDLKLGRLDLLDGQPRPARPVDDCDDLARHLVAERRGKHAGDYYPTPDVLVGDEEDRSPWTRTLGRHRADDDFTRACERLLDAIEALDDDPLPCRQPMTAPPHEPCDQPADPNHPEQLCDEHAGRRRT